MSKVIKLSEVSCNCMHWSPIDMLKEAQEIAKEEPRYKKALVIFLDDDGKYERRSLYSYFPKTTEVIALLEVVKQDNINLILESE